MHKHIFICITVIFLFVDNVQKVDAGSNLQNLNSKYVNPETLAGFSNQITFGQVQNQTAFPNGARFNPNDFGIYLFTKKNIIPQSALRKPRSIAMFGNINRKPNSFWFDEPYELIDTSRVAMNVRYGNTQKNISVTGQYLSNSDFMTKVVSYRYPLSNTFNLQGNLRYSNNNEYTSLGLSIRLLPNLHFTGQVTTNIKDLGAAKAATRISYRF